MAAAGVAIIAAGLFLHLSRPAVDPSPPQGYGAAPGPASGAEGPAAPRGGEGSSPDGGLLPDATPTSGPGPGAGTAVTVPVTSGRIQDLDSEPPPQPVRLRIAALGIDAPIQAVGVGDGEMEVPPRAGIVGWYRFGPSPGEQGSAVLAAHVSWGGERGAFYRLRDLPLGAAIEVIFADGAVRRFRSATLASYDKDHLPVEEIFRRGGDPGLTLITCGGVFNPSLRSFADNVVAFAVPVQEAFE